MDFNDLVKIENTIFIISRVVRLLLYGYREGFDKIDLIMEEFSVVYIGLFYKFYYRKLLDKYKIMILMD